MRHLIFYMGYFTSKQNAQSLGKRGKPQEDKLSKKFRGENSAGSSGKASNVNTGPGRPKSKNVGIENITGFLKFSFN